MEGLCVIWGRGDQIPFLGPDCGDHQQGFWCLPRAPHMQVPQTQAHSPPFQHAYPPSPLRAARGQAHSPEPSPPTWGLVLPRRHRVITGERGLRPPEGGPPRGRCPKLLGRGLRVPLRPLPQSRAEVGVGPVGRQCPWVPLCPRPGRAFFRIQAGLPGSEGWGGGVCCFPGGWSITCFQSLRQA